MAELLIVGWYVAWIVLFMFLMQPIHDFDEILMAVFLGALVASALAALILSVASFGVAND